MILQLVIISASLGLSMGCGGQLVGSGNITSPNYPNRYPMNSRCTWTLTATDEHDILLRPIHLDTQYLDDYIYVYNGIVDENSFSFQYVHRYSGKLNDSDANKKPLLLGPTATVMFYSDKSIEATGFYMEFTSVNITYFDDCGGDLYGEGNITSPNFPSPYPPNSRCLWKLTANPGRSIYLRIIEMNTESSFDYVLVFNSTKTSNTSFKDYLNPNWNSRCYGDCREWKVGSTGPSATIFFFSDSSISTPGFKIEYTSVDLTPNTGCGAHLVGSGSIASPNYPNRYPLNSRCKWTVAGIAQQDILLRLINLDIEKWNDYIHVYNGIVVENGIPSKFVHSYSGKLNDSSANTKPLLVGPAATVVFFSDSSVERSGFLMEFTSVNITHYTNCGGELFEKGNITSPDYPRPYPSNSRCSWTLTATPGKFISLRIIQLHTEDYFDYVLVFNGTRTNDSSFTDYSNENWSDMYYGDIFPSKLTPTGPSVTIAFFSDSSISASGFKIEYTSVDLTRYTECGGDLFGAGNITSPNYPGLYPLNCRCLWTITAYPGKFISLRIPYIDVEYTLDYVLVFNYTIMNNSSLDKFSYKLDASNCEAESGECFIRKLILPSHKATLLFISDHSVSFSGFRIEYESIEFTPFEDCGADLIGEGNITSPYYPSNYPHNSRCFWTLTAHSGKSILLRFITLSLERDFDYVYVINGTTRTNLSLFDNARWYSAVDYVASRYLHPWEPTLMGPSATVLFKSDSSIAAFGFQIEFTSIDLTPYTDCGGALFGAGNVTSPNYPNPYPFNCRCSWTLTADPGKVIVLRIIDVDTTIYVTDFVLIFNGTRTANSSKEDYLQRYFGRYSYQENNPSYRILKPIVVGPHATITFTSDHQFAASGFQIEYTSVDLTPYTDCGGDLFGSGNITSPNYPMPYPLNCGCSWTLTANPGQFISLRIITLNTEIDRDYVFVFDGIVVKMYSRNDYSYPYPRRYNGRMESYSRQPILLGPKATIQFVTDESISSSGFQIEFTGVEANMTTGCGGDLFDAGNITSPNFPGPYPSNILCSWTLTAYPEKFVSLRIIRLDTEKFYDYVYIFNGTRTINSSLYDSLCQYSGSGDFPSSYCRSSNGSRYYNSANSMLTGPRATIVFISDSSTSASGFQIEYTSADKTPLTEDVTTASATPSAVPFFTAFITTSSPAVVTAATKEATADIDAAASSTTATESSVTAISDASQSAGMPYTVVKQERSTLSTVWNAAATDMTNDTSSAAEGEASTAADSTTGAVTTSSAEARGNDNSSVAATTAASTTSDRRTPLVPKLRPCNLHRNITTSALPNA